MSAAILEVTDLHVSYRTRDRVIKAVDGATFDIQPGERFGLVGESGSGKSTIAMAILRLIKPPGKIEGGEIWLRTDGLEKVAIGRSEVAVSDDGDGIRVNLSCLSEEQMRRLRLAGIALIPQGAMNSLNPVARIRAQVLDGLRDHGQRLARRDRDVRVRKLLESVGLDAEVAKMYPHELSGGMKQRVAIAIAVSMRPRLIIADEPTSALDVMVQRQVMETLRERQEGLKSSLLMVGHDMGLMAQAVDRVGVMRAGKLVEVGTVTEVFGRPKDNYTQMLIASIPSVVRKARKLTTTGFDS